MVKRFTQSYIVDYQKIYTLVAKVNTIKILLSYAANLDWNLHKFDVKNTFLHRNLEEQVYMKISQELEDEKTQTKLCKLKKVLYRLKQSPRAWFERFRKVIIYFRYQQSNVDHTLFNQTL